MILLKLLLYGMFSQEPAAVPIYTPAQPASICNGCQMVIVTGCACQSCHAWYNITEYASKPVNPNDPAAPLYALADGLPGERVSL